MVDDKGNPKKYYHGTPDGGFEEFKEDSHFTENRKYAENYTNPSASSSGVKKEGKNPFIYEVYLSIKKPFDTRIPENAKIFNEQYYRKWGMGTPLMESGLPDWNDSRDLLEWINETGQDFDGVLVDEGSTPDLVMEGLNRGIAYIPVNPNQIKATDAESFCHETNINKSLKII